MRFGIDGRGMIRTRDGAIAAPDAFVRVNAHQTKFVFMHGTRRAHVHAFGIGAVIACERYVVAKRCGFRSAIGGKLARAALVIDYTAVSTTHR